MPVARSNRSFPVPQRAQDGSTPSTLFSHTLSTNSSFFPVCVKLFSLHMALSCAAVHFLIHSFFSSIFASCEALGAATLLRASSFFLSSTFCFFAEGSESASVSTGLLLFCAEEEEDAEEDEVDAAEA